MVNISQPTEKVPMQNRAVKDRRIATLAGAQRSKGLAHETHVSLGSEADYPRWCFVGDSASQLGIMLRWRLQLSFGGPNLRNDLGESLVDPPAACRQGLDRGKHSKPASSRDTLPYIAQERENQRPGDIDRVVRSRNRRKPRAPSRDADMHEDRSRRE